MPSQIDLRLKEKGIKLDAPAPPAANYVPFVISQSQIFVSGQLPMAEGKIKYSGRVGAEVSIDQARDAARLCAINILAQVNSACNGDLGRIRRCVKLGGFVNAVENFEQHPHVINGASDLIVDILGDPGRHARSAVGVPHLPFNVPVEIDAIFEIR